MKRAVEPLTSDATTIAMPEWYRILTAEERQEWRVWCEFAGVPRWPQARAIRFGEGGVTVEFYQLRDGRPYIANPDDPHEDWVAKTGVIEYKLPGSPPLGLLATWRERLEDHLRGLAT